MSILYSTDLHLELPLVVLHELPWWGVVTGFSAGLADVTQHRVGFGDPAVQRQAFR